jgi:hypothetical protein
MNVFNDPYQKYGFQELETIPQTGSDQYKKYGFEEKKE